MKNALIRFIVLYAFFVTGCSRDDHPGNGNPGEGLPKFILDSITWKADNLVAKIQYNNDTTEHEIIYLSPLGTDTVKFEYNNKKVTRITSSRSQRKSEYVYNNAGQVSSILMSSLFTLTVFILDFTYAPDGKPASLEYYLKNEAGKELISHSSYGYSADGLPEKITSVSKDGHTIVWTIEGYSDECAFNPWVFISHTSLEELYEFYNYPLLSTIKRLPKKIIKTSGEVEKIYHSVFSITSKRLDKLVSSGEFPRNPEYNYSNEAGFFYR